jgi:pimeloyl-ACP methyl ester carboxylesterase
MKTIYHLIIALGGTIYISSAHAQKNHSTFQYDSNFVSVNGNLLLAFTAGTGKNTIVFESGLGVNGKTWFTNQIFQKLSANNQVIAYNRAGYAPSSIGDELRNVQQLANDLKEVIQLLSHNNQVIIVGHSVGGSIARMYAIQNREKVKALLLIDPNHEKFTPYANISQQAIDTLTSQLFAMNETGAALEAKELIKNISLLRALPHLPNIPVTVLTSIKTEDGMSQSDVDDWVAAHASLGEGIKNFVHIKTAKSGHFIYEEKPRLFFKYLRKLLKN